ATITEGTKDVEKLVFAVMRGDMDLNETKLTNAVKAKELRPAKEEEISAIGVVAGYASPIGLEKVLVVIDDLAAASPNLVAGANETGFHYKNVNYERDFNAQIVTDIVSAEEGYQCHSCEADLTSSRGVEVGNIFKLGTFYTEKLGATFLNKNGKATPIVMGSYGIGSGRLLASIAEEYNDEYGLIWPITISPYHVYLVALRGGEEEADQLYQDLTSSGLEVLYDDRDESPGVKFNDADLIGISIRLTVSKRSLENDSVEMKLRRDKDRSSVPLAEVVKRTVETKNDLEAEIAAKVSDMPFER
ncbi:MAG: His/Gly/Thr/Pro-type tRNA ligase C-terminal domain-containing protein, partial [Chloroflexota bacterium]